MRSIISSILLLAATATSAQTMEWVVPLHLTIPANYKGMAMAAAPSGTVYIFGPTANAIIYGSDLFGDLELKQFSTGGDVVSSTVFPGQASANAMVEFYGSLFIVGQFKDSLHLPGHPVLIADGVDVVGSYICRLEPDGTVTWVKDVEDLGAPGVAQDIAVDGNGIFHVAVWDFQNSTVLVVDTDCQPYEVRLQTGVGILSSLSLSAGGVLAVAGSCLADTADFNGTEVTHALPYTLFAARYSPNGILMDHVIIEDVTCAFPRVVMDDAGGYYLSGDANLETPVGPFTIQESEWVHALFVVYVDANGTITWLKQPTAGPTIGDAGRGIGKDMVLHPGGGIWQGGSARGENDWCNGFTTTATIPGSELFLWHLDPDGTTQAVITGDTASFMQVTHSLARSGSDVLYMLAAAYDTLQLGGTTIPAQGNDLYLSRWSGLSIGIATHAADTELFVYPSPSKDQLVIDLAAFHGQVRIEIVDVKGRRVHTEQRAAGNRATLDISMLRPASYVITAAQGEMAKRARFVKQ